MPRAVPRKLLPRLLFGLLLSACIAVTATSVYVGLTGSQFIVPLLQAPQAKVAIVFGAGLHARAQPSPVLAERLDMAIALYRAGKVQKLLLSGDNSDRSHDETRAMRRYVIDRGIPAADAVGDFAGLSTYDTCYRARSIFGVNQALLVTQRFHLPRALYIARGLSIEAWGVAADEAHPRLQTYVWREFFSRALAFVTVAIKPQPRIGGAPLPIQ